MVRKYSKMSTIKQMPMQFTLVILLVALVLASFAVVAKPLNNADAAIVVLPPRVSISPTQGAAGTMATVSGQFFAAYAEVTIIMGDFTLNTGTLFTDSLGSFSTSVTIPRLSPGLYIVYAMDDYKSASCFFTVTTATVTVLPTQGAAGTVATVSGQSFARYAEVTIIMGGFTLDTGTLFTDSLGSFSTSVTIPRLSPGLYIITATDTAENSSSCAFTILGTEPEPKPTPTPVMRLSPHIAPLGAMVTLTGSTFIPNDTIPIGGITFMGMSWNTSPIRVQMDGGWEAILPVPEWASAASFLVQVRTTGDSWASSMLIVTNPEQEVITPPSAPKGPAEGIVGQSLSYSTDAALSSMGHDIQTQFEWGNGTQSEWLDGGGSVIVSASHSWPTAGTYSVRARARCKIHTEIYSEWSQASNVAIKPKQAIMDLSPQSGSPGTMVTLTGSNFVANDTIPVGGLTFDASPWNTSPITANEAGGWRTILPVPDSASPGTRIVKAATQKNTTASNPFTVLSTPPPPQPTISPTLPFAISKLVIDPKTISPSGNVTVSADIENVDDAERSETILFKIEDEVVTTKLVTLAAGQKTTIAFTVSRDTIGSYDVAIGELRGDFKVVKSTPGVRWSIVGGTIFAVIVLVLLALFIRRLVREV